ncbi:unnamed protein product [Soboliphyme baturini]|uniref:Ephrin RBD domain-containing protein n=1 Tax=Soboliphyme baturini TaxID=241478 RepID=A0A183IKW2_9BILA|nr:unnamed protein product [Soboliphyme baturini]
MAFHRADRCRHRHVSRISSSLRNSLCETDWLTVTAVVFVLLLASLATCLSSVSAVELPDIYWNSSNPL